MKIKATILYADENANLREINMDYQITDLNYIYTNVIEFCNLHKIGGYRLIIEINHEDKT